MAKILIVENELGHLATVTASLRRAGVEVLEARCIAGALETAREQEPDIIVTADSFADLDCVDLLELKSTEPVMSEMGVVVVSESSERKLDCFKVGCDDFVSLPVDEAELFFRICALLRRIGAKGVRGSFDDISILDLIQMLVAARRNGRLAVEFRDANGTMFFRDGHVFHATLGAESGEEAFLTILRKAQHTGTFVFSAEDCGDVPNTIEKRTDHLLLALANMLDEGTA
ncbi:MAG: DUF4388 domain-containing protein [Bdellovibrionota bacterium]